MPIANNLFTAAIIAPFASVLSALALATLQRATEWISAISKNPQKGQLRQIRPYIKHVDAFIERLMGANKITINTTNILLMLVAILLIVMILEANEKPKTVTIVNKKKPTSPEANETKTD